MLINTIKRVLCLITATLAFNAQAIVVAELDEAEYQWVEFSKTAGIRHMQEEEKLTGKPATLYEYEYTSRELKQDLSHLYAPWYGTNEWHSDDSTVNNARISTSEHANESSPSVKVLLLIISGLIGIFGLTKDRSQL